MPVSISARVLDLFRSWDANGDGEVSRAEFHKAVPALGLDVPKPDVDELFETRRRYDSGDSRFGKQLWALLRAMEGGRVERSTESAHLARGIESDEAMPTRVAGGDGTRAGAARPFTASSPPSSIAASSASASGGRVIWRERSAEERSAEGEFRVLRRQSTTRRGNTHLR